MSDVSPSPLSDSEDELDEYAVFEAIMFRVTTSDEEWENDPLSNRWDLSREEAATRLFEEDYSPPS